ncbi:MAG TPA: acetate--CoA ligase family protein [Methylomirabilota bacterium]|nr:acetate--CoA ligase family protein [Methylomirabilota bacterium]
MNADLTPLFAPRRVAVLGVSRSPDKLGHRLLKNLLDWQFAGDVFPVNPSGEAILGLKTVPRVRDLPDDVDLALVSLPAAAVVDAVRDLGHLGCRAAVVLTSGFGESGGAGPALQAELAAIARATGMRIVGPNCMGVVNVPGRLNGSYFWDVPRAAGGISFLSQSGAYGGLFFREVRSRGLGVARFLSIGNQADLGFAECLAWLAADPATRVVGLFVEGVRGDGRRFVEAAQQAAGRKPVVAFKVGRGGAGRRAAGSHTGSLAGEYATYQAAFAAAGVVLTEETEAFFDALVALDAQGERRPAGAAIAILTVSGGPAVAAADAAEAAGLLVPPLPDGLRHRLRAHLPSFGADGNPVDMTPQMDGPAFAPAVRLVLEAPEIAGAVAIDVGLDQPAFGEALATAQAVTGKPVVACTADTPAVDHRLRAAGIPIFPTPERAVRAYRALWAAAAGGRGHGMVGPRPAPPLPAPLAAALGRTAGPLPYGVSRAILEHYGVTFPAEGTVASVEEALSVAGQIGYPVVVKTAAPHVVHRTDVGGVVLGIGDEAALRAGVAAIGRRLGPGPLLIQREVAGGIELLVGGRRDAVFGPVVAVGLGGVLTEALDEVTLRLAPFTPVAAMAMLREGRTARLLQCVRGGPPVDEERLAALVAAIGDLLVAHPEIVELDVNPLIVHGDQAVAVDALIIVEPGRPKEETHA